MVLLAITGHQLDPVKSLSQNISKIPPGFILNTRRKVPACFGSTRQLATEAAIRPEGGVVTAGSPADPV